MLIKFSVPYLGPMTSLITLEDFISYNSLFISELIKSPSDEVMKWRQTVDNLLKINFNDDSKNKICVYMELVSFYTRMVRFGENIDVNAFISNLNRLSVDRRSRVIGKVFNYKTSSFEYELEDGNFVDIKNPQKFDFDLDNSVFPPCFVKCFNLNSYRDIIIENTLND